uniref:ATP synthase F0 subunit 8 n=1 Tax=Eudohrnia metallica TaxID=2021301 RepID=A0A678RW92_9NEOP|nr:ATP synthase F0 subunit 8 [Eudohrnia metallica]
MAPLWWVTVMGGTVGVFMLMVGLNYAVYMQTGNLSSKTTVKQGLLTQSTSRSLLVWKW